MSAAVEIQDVEVTFTKRGQPDVHALGPIDLTLAPGEFVSVVGPSGCGKSTLLRAIAGLQEPTSGSLLIDDEPVVGPRRETCVMFQAPTLLPWLNVRDNCLLPFRIKHKPTSADRETTRGLLKRAGLAEFEHSYPHELSGGMQQRVAMCRALGPDPSLLLLDEPFGALDAMTRDQMNLDLHVMWSRDAVTTMLITHSITEAVFLSQRVIVMTSRPGRIAEIIDVPLPARRDASVLTDEAFSATCARIRAHFTQGENIVSD